MEKAKEAFAEIGLLAASCTRGSLSSAGDVV